MSETNNSNEVVVSIKNLQKAFGDNVVLRDIDLDVHKGEVVVVLGPSGSGKSTMHRPHRHRLPVLVHHRQQPPNAKGLGSHQTSRGLYCFTR